MELKKFLKNNPIILKKELAEQMYPGNKSASSKLANKLADREVGSGKQRILEKDIDDSIRALSVLKDNIEEYIESNKK